MGRRLGAEQRGRLCWLVEVRGVGPGELRDVVTSSVSDVRARPTAAAWTGWALAASMHVMFHDRALPVPGRGDPSSKAGRAYRIGRGLVITAALDVM